MPVDREPSEFGTMIMFARDRKMHVTTRDSELGQLLARQNVRAHKSHFATCPNAGKHRRKKK